MKENCKFPLKVTQIKVQYIFCKYLHVVPIKLP